MPELRYINPEAQTKEVFVFGVTHAPLVYGASYSVPLPLVEALLNSGEWERTTTAVSAASKTEPAGKRSKTT